LHGTEGYVEELLKVLADDETPSADLDVVELPCRIVRVTRQLNKPGAAPVFGPPKSRAGRRVVLFASLIVPDLRKHLGSLPSGAPLAFTSPEGTALSNSNFWRRVWLPALAAVGLSEIHIHDLRHAGN
jgi:integrase